MWLITKVLPAALLGNAVNLPVLVVLVVGIIVSLIYRRQAHPTSRLVLVAFSILFLQILVGNPGSFLLAWVIYDRTGSATQLGIVSWAVGFIRTLISASAFVLLLVALFRPQRQQMR